MVDFATIANNAISELQRVKNGTLQFKSPTFLAIREDDTIEHSNLWLILDKASIAVVIVPYYYIVLTAEDSSAFVLFIDSAGRCSDSIEINGWRLQFDTPKEKLYRTYNRYATISKGIHRITLQTPCGTLTPYDFKRIWIYFKKISKINADYSSLPLFKELYDNEIIIDDLKRENIREEYERYISSTLLKANEELINNIIQITKNLR